MEILDLVGTRQFSVERHMQKSLAESPRCAVSIACWEPGQVSPIHSHPGADEIYHVLVGDGVFRDGRSARRLASGGTVFFPAGEAHQVQSLTRMVLYRLQAGADRAPAFFDTWPA
jgi:quercetin dioxygenase-like cupin family protein